MAVKVLITILCGVGLYASLFMLGKARRAARGELRESSVVETPRARLFGGVSNALLGACYYPALAIATWLSLGRPFALLVFAIALFAAAVSVVLAYSLLFVTRRPCTYCWTSHAINWLLVVLLTVDLWSDRLLR
ncbi:MAG TPA: vitamin K epoxide reductase family protein [Candidatus Tyrphobacter sp.]